MIKKIFKILLICLFLSFALIKTDQLFAQIKQTLQVVNHEPKDKSYIADELDYLKTYYLMKKGIGYYQARYEAQRNIAGDENERIWKKDLWGWRLPTVFYFWKIFTNTGGGIFYLFILMSLIVLIASYLIAKKFIKKQMAFLAPIILYPYFLNALRSTAFLFTEWWANFFFIIALMLFYYKKNFFSAVFFAFAVISREFFIIPVFLMLGATIISKKNWLVFLIPLVIFLLILTIHSHQVSSLVNLETLFGGHRRIGVFNKQTLLATLAFSTNSYLLVDVRPSLIWIIFSLGGLIYSFVKNKDKYSAIIALFSFAPLMTILPFMGNIWEDYWGAIYVPMAGIFSLTILRILNDH